MPESSVTTDVNENRNGILLSELFQAYHQMADMDMLISELSTNLQNLSSASKMLEKEKVKQVNELKNQLRTLTDKYQKLEEKLDVTKQKLGQYTPRNVNKRIVRKDKSIQEQKVIIDVLEENVIELDMKTMELEEKLRGMTEKYENERKKVYYWKKKSEQNPTEESQTLRELKKKVAFLEDQNCRLEDQIDELLNEDYVKTFENGKYTKEVRQVYYELLSMNVSVRNCEKIIRTVLEKLGRRNIDRLPKKSVSSMMMVESRLLAQIQTTEAMLSGKRNVLHLDGTKLRFEELGSFQVVTESGSYSMSVEDMLSGEGECYYDTFRDVLTEMAALIVPDNQVEQKVRELLFPIKNIMTDRAAPNKTFVEHLSSWRSEILPFVVDKYDELPNEEKIKVTRMNHLFCGLHVVHNMGIYAETGMKEWLKVVCLLEKHGGFTTSNSRVYDLLFEISKLCAYTHGDQRNGKAPYWEAALEKKGRTNMIISFLHH